MLHADPEWSHGAYWIVHDADGVIVAQGSREMCERIARESRSKSIDTGDLFDDRVS